jgi:hypothetical protein
MEKVTPDRSHASMTTRSDKVPGQLISGSGAPGLRRNAKRLRRVGKLRMGTRRDQQKSNLVQLAILADAPEQLEPAHRSQAPLGDNERECPLSQTPKRALRFRLVLHIGEAELSE